VDHWEAAVKATIPGGFKYSDSVNTGGYNEREDEGESRGAGYHSAIDNAGISSEVGDIDVPRAKARAIKASYSEQYSITSRGTAIGRVRAAGTPGQERPEIGAGRQLWGNLREQRGRLHMAKVFTNE